MSINIKNSLLVGAVDLIMSYLASLLTISYTCFNASFKHNEKNPTSFYFIDVYLCIRFLWIYFKFYVI